MARTDLLLCAIARSLAIYTTDRDFSSYAKVLRLKLHALGD